MMQNSKEKKKQRNIIEIDSSSRDNKMTLRSS